MACRISPHIGPIADVYVLDGVEKAPGFSGAGLAGAWALADQSLAGAILAGDAA